MTSFLVYFKVEKLINTDKKKKKEEEEGREENSNIILSLKSNYKIYIYIYMGAYISVLFPVYIFLILKTKLG